MYAHTNLVCYSRGRLAPILIGFASEFLLLATELCRGGRQREHYIHGEEQDGGRSESRREGRRRKREIYTITHTPRHIHHLILLFLCTPHSLVHCTLPQHLHNYYHILPYYIITCSNWCTVLAVGCCCSTVIRLFAGGNLPVKPYAPLKWLRIPLREKNFDVSHNLNANLNTVCACACICMCVLMYVCMYVCMVCMYVCMSFLVYTSVCC